VVVTKIPHPRTSLLRVRKAVYAIIAAGLVAVIVIGLVQSSSKSTTPQGKGPDLAAARRALAGSPPALAALHARASTLVGGGRSRYTRTLAGLRGHPVVVNIWASWCGPCRLEFPAFQQQSVHYGRNVGFLGVDSGDNRGNAASFLRQFPVSYPSVEDPGQRVAQNLGLRGLPGTAYYDGRGHLVYIHQGFYPTTADLGRDIERYLGVHAGS